MSITTERLAAIRDDLATTAIDVLAVIADVQRLEGELVAANARIKELEGAAVPVPVPVDEPPPVDEKISNLVVTNPSPGYLRPTWTGPKADVFVQGDASGPLVPVLPGLLASGTLLKIPIADAWFGLLVKGPWNELKWDATPSNYKPAPAGGTPPPPPPPTGLTVKEVGPADFSAALNGQQTPATQFQVVTGTARCSGTLSDVKAGGTRRGDRNQLVAKVNAGAWKQSAIIDEYSHEIVVEGAHNVVKGLSFVNGNGDALKLQGATDFLVEDVKIVPTPADSQGKAHGRGFWISGAKNGTLRRVVMLNMKDNQNLARIAPSEGNNNAWPSELLYLDSLIGTRFPGDNRNPVIRIMGGKNIVGHSLFLGGNGDGEVLVFTDKASEPQAAMDCSFFGIDIIGRIKFWERTRRISFTNMRLECVGTALNFSPDVSGVEFTNCGFVCKQIMTLQMSMSSVKFVNCVTTSLEPVIPPGVERVTLAELRAAIKGAAPMLAQARAAGVSI